MNINIMSIFNHFGITNLYFSKEETEKKWIFITIKTAWFKMCVLEVFALCIFLKSFMNFFVMFLRADKH